MFTGRLLGVEARLAKGACRWWRWTRIGPYGRLYAKPRVTEARGYFHSRNSVPPDFGPRAHAGRHFNKIIPVAT